MQKKLKKVEKKAEVVMSQEGVNEVSKLRQVSKMYDREKRGLKDEKKYVRSSKSRTSKGKDTRNVKHVDSRLKKDKRSVKISKKRMIKRKDKRKGKF
jgi:AdoMet-dependent rRNA methyltransferase SPB1